MSAIFRAIDGLGEPRYSVLDDVQRPVGRRRRSRRRRGADGDTGMLEQVEPRVLLSAAPYVPPQFVATPTNPQQVVRVIVLNFDPRVPTQQNRLMHEVFNWSDPHELAQGFEADLEWATGGAIDIQVVEWRDLDAFPTFTDGFRYNPDEYVQFRNAAAGWHDTGTDFYELIESQGLGPMINAGQVDEIWTFGDHYFSLLGEAWMGGPNSFFINGPSYEDAGFDRAIAGYGFNYERGVAEMIHNLCHRSENHGQRAFGSWNLAAPDSAFDKFSSNYLDTAAGPYGVGTCHVPANADGHYDYGDPRTVDSFAADFANYPSMTWDTEPVSPDTWRGTPSGDDHRDYMNWYFSMMPRNDGTDADGRAANWFKYIWDFNSYEADTGLARQQDAFGAGPIVYGPGGTSYDLTVRYYGQAGVDAATLDLDDVRVLAPGGATITPTAVDTGADVATTAGVARTATYTIEPPGGAWDVADNGTYRIELQSGEVYDLDAGAFPAGEVGSFRVALYDSAAINVSAMLASGEATATHTPFDTGAVENLFDGNTSTLVRTPSINPAEVTLEFDTPQTVTGFRSYFAAAWGDPAYEYVIEAADSVADLDAYTGSYVELVPLTGTPSDTYSAVTLAGEHTASVFRLTGERLTGDDYVHINEWELLGTASNEADAPTAALTAIDNAYMGQTAHFLSVTFTDATAVDVPSIANGDLLITGPGGTIAPAFYDVDNHSDGPARTATFWFIPPGGAWDYLDNGTYTIELQAGAVRDVLYNSAAAPQTLGTFDVSVTEPQTHPPADLAESNASDWVAWAQGASASTADDTSRTVAGAASVRFETDGGLDTSLTYPAPGVADWDLTAYADLDFSVYAENPSPNNFQEGPWVRLNGVGGGYFEYRYYENNNPATPLNGAIDQWSAMTIPLDPAVEATGWRRTTDGSPDLAHIASVEFHADTWDSGFTLWYDGVSFTGGLPQPTANLAQPPDGSTIALATINTNRYIDVTFVDYSGTGLSAAMILDTADEFTLGGPGVGTAAIVSGTPTHLMGDTYRYFTTGDFVAGMVNVDFIAGAWEDNDATPNAAETESFTVESPEADVELRIVQTAHIDDRMSVGQFAGYDSADTVTGVYVAEIWLRDTGDTTTGMAGGSVDITYTTAHADVTSLHHGTIYTELASGDLDDPAGRVDDLGGQTPQDGEGVSQWVRLGWAEMDAAAPWEEVTFTLEPGAASFTQVGAGTIDWEDVHFTGTPVTVMQGNRAPVAENDSFHVDENGSHSGTLVATDADTGDTLTYRIETPPSHGAVTALNADTGAFTYDPGAGYYGADAFTFVGNDTWADSNVATVAITVGPAMIGVTDSSGDTGDAAVQFITALSQFRAGASDVALVRPTCPDEGQYIDVTNVGGLPLTLSEIQIAAPDVTVTPALTGDDITLAPGETQRFALTYAPTLPSVADPTAQKFDLADGLKIFSDADNTPVFDVALRGASTFRSDVTYDGIVNLEELGVLNANFGKTWQDPTWDPTADVDGDGAINLAELGPTNAEFGRRLPEGLPGFGAEQLLQAGGSDIDVYSYSVPALADWNGDGTADLIVGEKTSAGPGKVRVYLNTATAAAPAYDAFFYAQSGGADLAIAATGCLGAFPRMFDWNRDGLKDLIVGSAQGTVLVFLNENTNAAPAFGSAIAAQVGLPASKVDINVGARATLDIVDWNNDGRFDLVMGAYDGRVRVFLNESASGQPDFRQETIVRDGGSDLMVPAWRSSVAVFDLDGDGRKDLVLGDTAGQLLFYANVGTDSSPLFDGYQMVEADGAAIDLPGLPRSRPFVGDFNGDGVPDLLVGSYDGLVRLYVGQHP